MKFLFLCSPTIKFLINKYQSSISLQSIDAEILTKFIGFNILLPSEVKSFVQSMVEIRKYLDENRIINRIGALRKIIGDGYKSKGLLNILQDQQNEIFVLLYEVGSLQNSEAKIQKIITANFEDLRVIAPLNLDECEEVYNFFNEKFQLPVYPLIISFLTSKWLKNITFSPYVPRAFYFPENTDALQYVNQIKTIAEKEKMEYVILKDEFDNDLRGIMPYSVAVVRDIEPNLGYFYEKAEGISNIGGLILEEFLTMDKNIQILKTFMFGKFIHGTQIQQKVILKDYKEGGFYDSLVISNTDFLLDFQAKLFEPLDIVITKYYPYLFSNVDAIIHNGVPKIIDVNGVVNNLNFAQINPNLDPDLYLKMFTARIISLKNTDETKKQLEYSAKMKMLYQNLHDFGPAFISGDKIISLQDMQEKSIKKHFELYLIN